MNRLICLFFLNRVTFVNAENHTASIRDLSERTQEFAKETILNKEIEDHDDPHNIRLPGHVVPLNYDLKVQVFLPGYKTEISEENRYHFTASVDIHILIKRNTANIVLQQRELQLKSLELVKSGSNYTIDTITRNNSVNEKLFILSSEPLEAGDFYNIKIVYSGILSDSLYGFYRSKYTNKNGEKRHIAVTQLEPTSARKLVPCFDEPGFKATWDVTVIHPLGTRALSNGHEKLLTKLKGWRETKFTRTPRMSSYLLAIIVSDFEYIQGFTKSGVKFRIWARPEAKDDLQYALSAGIKSLDFYEEYFGTKFPLEKQDMVAIPDFAAGAMENWGLITFRETNLIYDPKFNKVSEKKRVAEVIAHEVSHQWFGNLVTMKWWSDLWLNEGFASYMDALGAEHISDGGFESMKIFILDDQERGLRADALPETYPLSFKPAHSWELYEAFGTISYSKGASVIRMMRETLGLSIFDEGLRSYLDSFSYANAEASDLWYHIHKANRRHNTGMPVNLTDVFRQWTEQVSFPLLHVRDAVQNENGKYEWIVEQERYRYPGTQDVKEKYRQTVHQFKWDVPVLYMETDTGNQSLIWQMKHKPAVITTSSDMYPPVLQVDSNGFYRVKYSELIYKKLRRQLKQNHTIFSESTRTRLFLDLGDFLESGRMKFSQIWPMMDYKPQEFGSLPWKAILVICEQILHNFNGLPEEETAKEFFESELKPMYRRMNLTRLEEIRSNDTYYSEARLLSSFNLFFCEISPSCQLERRRMFEIDYIDKFQTEDISSEYSTMNVEVRFQVLCYGIANGSYEEWLRVLAASKVESRPTFRRDLLAALTCTRNETILDEILDDAMAIDSKWFRLQDLPTVFTHLEKNEVIRPKLFEYFLENFFLIYKKLLQTRSFSDSVIKALCKSAHSEEHLERLRNFRDIHFVTRELSVFTGVIASIEKRLLWRKRNLEDVVDFMKSTKFV